MGNNTRFLLRDRDAVYGVEFRDRVLSMGIEEVITAPRSPWQNPYVERVIGTLRRECLDHVIIINERHLQRILGSYLDYYHGSRTHLSLGKNTPYGRPVQPAITGKVISLPKVGGLHHRYERLAARLSPLGFDQFLSAVTWTLPAPACPCTVFAGTNRQNEHGDACSWSIAKSTSRLLKKSSLPGLELGFIAEMKWASSSSMICHFAVSDAAA